MTFLPGAIDFATISAGLLFSIACAVLIEEVILGGLFRLFFARRPAAPQSKQPTSGQSH